MRGRAAVRQRSTLGSESCRLKRHQGRLSTPFVLCPGRTKMPERETIAIHRSSCQFLAEPSRVEPSRVARLQDQARPGPRPPARGEWRRGLRLGHGVEVGVWVGCGLGPATSVNFARAETQKGEGVGVKGGVGGNLSGRAPRRVYMKPAPTAEVRDVTPPPFPRRILATIIYSEGAGRKAR